MIYHFTYGPIIWIILSLNIIFARANLIRFKLYLRVVRLDYTKQNVETKWIFMEKGHEPRLHIYSSKQLGTFNVFNAKTLRNNASVVYSCSYLAKNTTLTRPCTYCSNVSFKLFTNWPEGIQQIRHFLVKTLIDRDAETTKTQIR